MRIFPIYESYVLLNPKSNDNIATYLAFSCGDVYMLVTFYYKQPLYLRVFTDYKEFQKTLTNIKKSFKPYEHYKENLTYHNFD